MRVSVIANELSAHLVRRQVLHAHCTPSPSQTHYKVYFLYGGDISDYSINYAFEHSRVSVITALTNSGTQPRTRAVLPCLFSSNVGADSCECILNLGKFCQTSSLLHG